MNKKSLDSLRIYEWNETIKDERNADKKNLYEFPRLFQQEIKDASVHAKFTGVWGDWKITDESYGQYPVLKCYITKGTLEVDINNQKNIYNLQNTWIKVCTKIEKLSEEYIVPNKEGSIYCVNYDLPVSKKNEVLSTLIKELILTWFQKNSSLISKYINSYVIHYRTSNDLTLGGWDTNYATSFLNVNNIIKKQSLYPQKFSKKYEDNSLGATLNFAMDGNFDSWEMTTGADGQNVNFICKFGANSSFTNETAGQTYEFDSNAYIKIQLKLEYFDSEEKTIKDPSGVGDGYQKNLKVKSSYDNQGNPPVIIVNQYFSKTLETSKILESILITMFKEWYIENISEFETIFSYFLLEETAKDEDFQWLKPTTAYYGVSSLEDENGNPNLDKSVFSVMAMVENHKNENPQHLVDARLLQAVENESAFGIDTPLFVEKWLEKALIVMQVGTLDQFERTQNGTVIKNKERIKFATIADENWEGAEAYIDKGNFSFGIINSQLVLEMTNIEWKKDGRIAHVDYKQTFDLKLQSGIDKLGKSYENVLIPIENSEPVYRVLFTKDTWKFWSDFCTALVSGIGLGIAFGIIGKLSLKVLKKIKDAVRKVARQSGDNVVISSNAQGALNRPFQEYIQLVYLGEGGTANVGRLANNARNQVLSAPTTGSGAITITSSAMESILRVSKNFASKLWENKYKLIGGSVAGGMGFATTFTIANLIDNIHEEKFSALPTINNFVNNAVGTVKWPENSEFHIESAQFQGVFLLGGKLNKGL